MKRAYTNGILLDGTEQMQPVEHKILLTEDDKIIAIVDEGVDLDGYEAFSYTHLDVYKRQCLCAPCLPLC